MTSSISSFADEFPLADPDRLQPPQIDLGQYLNRLMDIVGYDDSVIHRNVEIKIPEDAYEPTDVDFGESFVYSTYVAQDRDSSPYLVGWGDETAFSVSGGPGGHWIYESMRVAHETANPSITLLLTPYDLLIYDGTGSLFHSSGPRPIEYYPLHESDFDQELSRQLRQELQPPSSDF